MFAGSWRCCTELKRIVVLKMGRNGVNEWFEFGRGLRSSDQCRLSNSRWRFHIPSRGFIKAHDDGYSNKKKQQQQQQQMKNEKRRRRRRRGRRRRRQVSNFWRHWRHLIKSKEKKKVSLSLLPLKDSFSLCADVCVCVHGYAIVICHAEAIHHRRDVINALPPFRIPPPRFTLEFFRSFHFPRNPFMSHNLTSPSGCPCQCRPSADSTHLHIGPLRPCAV